MFHMCMTADWLLSFLMTRCKELDDLPSLSPMQSISEEEAIQIVAHPLLPLSSFTLGDYIDHSETLQQLVQLGKSLTYLSSCDVLVC